MMKQNKDLIYVPQYDPDLKKMTRVLQILLDYELNNKKQKELILNPKLIELLRKANS